MMRQGVLLLVLLASLAGCNMGEPNRFVGGREDVKKEMEREPEWSKVPALRRIPVSSDLFLARSVRPPMPGKAANRPINLRFNKGNATINDLIGIMDYEGIPVIIRSSGGTGATSDDIGDLVLPFRRYDGNLGNLIKKIGRSLDLSIWWENDALFISDRDRFVVSVPQQQDVIDTVVGELEDFGAEDISPSLYGGRIIYSARPQANEEIIVPYLNGLAGNLAEITLQVAVVQLQVNNDSQRGIDWSSFQLQFGDPARTTAGSLINPKELVTGPLVPSGTSVFGKTIGATGTSAVSGAGGTTGTLSGSQLTKIGDNVIGISGAIQYLSQFGRTSTRQMVELRTLAGQPVQLVSSQTTPYVKGISGTSSTSSGSNNVTTTVDTASIDTGLNMGFTPYYDSLMALVVVDVNIQVSSLLSLETLSYGNTTGNASQSIKQPKTSKNQITDIVRIPAGEVVILGGLHQEDKSDKRIAPYDAFDEIGSRNDSDTTTYTFFIMRPVVTIFDPKGTAVNTVLPGDGIDSSEKFSEPDSAVIPEPDANAILPTTDNKKPRPKSVEDLYANDNQELPTVAKVKKKSINNMNLEKVLNGGFAGLTGLETQEVMGGQ